jgi:hypothetical protein
MNELACIRIKVSEIGGAGDAAHLRGLIGKFTDYFLGQRWRAPRRHQALAPGCFMLSDPRATHLDIDELNELAGDLQYHLFGESASGSVQIYALWGEPAEVAEFSVMNDAALEAAIRSDSGVAGRLVRVESRGVSAAAAPPSAPAPAPTTALEETCFRGVYFTPRKAFFGSIVGARTDIGGKRYDLLAVGRPPNEEAELEYDLITLRMANRLMERGGPPGMQYVPLSFRTAMTRMRLERIKPWLDRLARFDKSRLAANLYAPPATPPFEALALAHESLRGAFSVVGLEVVSPDFPCHAMVTGCGRSMCLVVGQKSPAKRLADIDAFLDRLDEFKAAKVWAAVGNLQTKDELELAVRRKAPFVWGSAVTGVLSQPVRLDAMGEERLPLLAA